MSCTSCTSAAPAAPKAVDDFKVGQILAGKLVMSTILLYMLYIAITCPCKPLYDCHIRELYISVGLVVAVLVYFNGLRLTPLK